MKQWRLEYPVEAMARILEVSRSGFYAWLERPPSARALEDERLKVAISAAHVKTRESYGAARLQAELQSEGFAAGRDRIARLRRDLGIRCRQKRKFKATTNSNHDLPVAENLLQQDSAERAFNKLARTYLAQMEALKRYRGNISRAAKGIQLSRPAFHELLAKHGIRVGEFKARLPTKPSGSAETP